MNIKEIKEVKTELTKSASKGFGYFFKNFMLSIIVLLLMYIPANPECLMDPKSYLENFTFASLGVVGIAFVALLLIFYLVKNIHKVNKETELKDTIRDYKQVVERQKELDKEIHLKLMEERLNIGPHISNELKSLLIKLDADKACVIEMHNGTNNFGGLPFIYGDMVYEEISPEVLSSIDDFKDINLGKLPFMSLHYKEGTWIGSVDEIENEDPYFAGKLRISKVEYGAVFVLEGVHSPIGFLLVFFADGQKHPTKSKIISAMNHSSQVISNLLSKTRYPIK